MGKVFDKGNTLSTIGITGNGIGEQLHTLLENPVLRIAIVGAPQSGKTSLIEYLRNYLKKDYQVVIAEEVPTRLLKSGLNPPYSISGLEFQLECLKEYSKLYEQIEYNLDNYLHFKDKPIIILYDTLPSIGQCYLSIKEPMDFKMWEMAYNNESINYNDHKPNQIFITELLQGEYSPKGNVVRRELETQKVLSIAEKIDNLYGDESMYLSNNYNVEERAGEVINFIESYFIVENAKQGCPRCANCPLCNKQYKTNIGWPPNSSYTTRAPDYYTHTFD